jgi:adenylate kinase
VKVAISGTPGTGKSSVGIELARRGRNVLELSEFVESHLMKGRKDRSRDTYEVDVEAVDELLKREHSGQDTIYLGHLTHFLTVDLIVVLRCRPSILKARLEGRGYSKKKITENMEAEGCDVILVEAIEIGTPVCEIDTTSLDVIQVANAVEEILGGERKKYEPGHVDWSEEVLGWY